MARDDRCPPDAAGQERVGEHPRRREPARRKPPVDDPRPHAERELTSDKQQNGQRPATGNRLHTLDLSGVALCGLDPAGKPKLTGEYRSDSIELLCDAIESENCVLKVSALMGTDGH